MFFSQVLPLVDRHAFAASVRRHRGDHGAKGFACWAGISDQTEHAYRTNLNDNIGAI